jgi:subfamily B ATP-binding cassette protein HlyB/CyaB
VDAVQDGNTEAVSAAPAADTGLLSLCLIARHLGVPADPGELARRHIASSSGASSPDLVRIARKLGLKARLVATRWDRLAKTPLPAIAEQNDQSFLVAGRFFEGKLLVHSPTAARGRLVERHEFEETWSGRLILIGRRASLANLPDVFDLRWFITAVRRYRRIIGEVLIA